MLSLGRHGQKLQIARVQFFGAIELPDARQQIGDGEALGDFARRLAESARDFFGRTSQLDKAGISFIFAEFVHVLAGNILDQGDFEGGGVIQPFAHIAFDGRE